MGEVGGRRPIFELASDPVSDRLWHRALMTAARFRAWPLGGVCTAGSAAVLVREDGSILLVKPWYRRGWGLPGGFMKQGEQAVDALRREIFEETGLEIEAGSAHEVYLQRGRRHIDHLFLLKLEGDHSPAPQTRWGISAAAWHSPDAPPALQREAHDALCRVSAEP